MLPECLDDFIDEDNPVRVVDVFVDELDLRKLGFDGAEPATPGARRTTRRRCSRSTSTATSTASSRAAVWRREAQRNVELIWLTGRLTPDFKTIADFRRDNGEAIRKVCREFVVLCRRLSLFTAAIVAIDGSKFKAVNNRDKNFTDRQAARRECSSSRRASIATWANSTARTVKQRESRCSGSRTEGEDRRCASRCRL